MEGGLFTIFGGGRAGSVAIATADGFIRMVNASGQLVWKSSL